MRAWLQCFCSAEGSAMGGGGGSILSGACSQERLAYLSENIFA